MLTVPIPERMKHLELDPRGYPIPVMVWRDNTGIPYFTINDTNTRFKIIRQELCSICGTKLFRGRWFVGGPLSAFHPNGAYNDPPMHLECAEYALKVCPYLAAPSYAKRIDTKKVKSENISSTTMFIDPTMMPNRPEIFVAVHARGHKVGPFPDLILKPLRPYIDVRFWRQGVQIPTPEEYHDTKI